MLTNLIYYKNNSEKKLMDISIYIYKIYLKNKYLFKQD